MNYKNYPVGSKNDGKIDQKNVKADPAKSVDDGWVVGKWDSIFGPETPPPKFGIMLRPASRRRPGGPIVWHVYPPEPPKRRRALPLLKNKSKPDTSTTTNKKDK